VAWRETADESTAADRFGEPAGLFAHVVEFEDGTDSSLPERYLRPRQGVRRVGESHKCGYNEVMSVATSRVEVGVRDLKNNLSRYLDRVQKGTEVVVTDRGRPVARLSAIDHQTEHLAELIASGIVRAPKRATRHRPASRIKAMGPVSDLVAEQRR
jgi:prevent-host-death family protein